MKIRNQKWIEFEDHIFIIIRSPFWSAAQKYGWDRDVEGIGIAEEAIARAELLGKKIRVKIIKYGTYEITPKKAKNIASNFTFLTRDNKYLLVIPRDAFTRVNS